MVLKILVTAPGFESAAAQMRTVAEVDVIWSDTGTLLTEEKLVNILPKYDAAIVWIDPIRSRAINAARDVLKVIGVPRAGYDNIDIDTASEAGIPVIYSPGMNSAAVADFTLGLILGLSRGIVSSNMQLKTGKWAGRWAMLPRYSLQGKVLGIIGLGNIGARVALRAKAFEMKVIAFDPYVKDDVPTLMGMFPNELGVEMVDLKTILRTSDFITVHTPISSKTTRMMGEKEFNIMKKEAYLVNVSRGGIVDEKALYTALKNNKLAGAALDVFENEPLKLSNPLITLDNVIVTPHIAWCTHESMARSNMTVATEVLKVLDGKKPTYKFLANHDVLENRVSRYSPV